MKTILIFGFMQMALLQAYAQRGGHDGRGSQGYSSGRSYTGGRFNGGPNVTHAFGRSGPGHNYDHYSEAPVIRGGTSRYYAARPMNSYYYRGVSGRPYYHGDYYRGYGSRIYAGNFFRNWVFGWGLGYWNPAIVWQQSFYLKLFNCYNSGEYYQPGYYNGYISNFDQVIQSINNQQNDDNKMAVAKEAIQNRNISTSQTAEIMNCFASDQAKIDFAEYAFPQVSDKQNFYKVNNTFRNPDSAQQLGSYLDAQYGNRNSEK